MKKKLFSFLEIVFWLGLVVGFLFFLISLFHPDLDVKKIYEVDFRDVDGIIVGSPVRFMGVDIGHVKKIKILDDRVRLVLALTRDDCRLPKASMVRIEASGLGGSRSLELFPSSEIFQVSKIASVEPKRIDDLLLSSNEFIKSMTSGMTNMTRMLEITLNSEEYAHIDEINEDLAKFDDVLRNVSKVLEEKHQSSADVLMATKESMQKQFDMISKINIDKTSLNLNFAKLDENLNHINKSLAGYNSKDFKNNAYSLMKKTRQVNVKEREVVKCELRKMILMMKDMQKIFNSFEKSLTSENINKARVKVQKMKESSKEINKYVKEEK